MKLTENSIHKTRIIMIRNSEDINEIKFEKIGCILFTYRQAHHHLGSPDLEPQVKYSRKSEMNRADYLAVDKLANKY